MGYSDTLILYYIGIYISYRQIDILPHGLLRHIDIIQIDRHIIDRKIC